MPMRGESAWVAALESAWVENQGAACTTAAVLAALGALGARGLPELGAATLLLGARVPFGAPALLDYVALPGRRPPLDRRIEALAGRHGLRVTSHTAVVARPRALVPSHDEMVVANLGWGQEEPGRWGSWGFHPALPGTWSTGGHSVVLAQVLEDRGWLVLDPNHRGLQRWPRPGRAVTATRISLA